MKTVCLFSGGIDSTAMVFSLRQSDEVIAVSIDYGQRHAKELQAAEVIAGRARFRHEMVDVRNVGRLMRGSSLTDPSVAVPEGHFEAESMKATVVPNRNMILIAVAGALAVAEKADRVAYAAHAGDRAIYPDCRTEFGIAMAGALALCDWHPVGLYAPFVGMSKAQIIRVGDDAGARLDLTWSCYKGEEFHCGKCGACVERIESFLAAGVEDRTIYSEGGRA